MLKKIIAVSVLGVSSLGMVAANATTNGIYITGQAGYADTHMKDKMTIHDAVGSGFVIPNTGLAGRLAVGYQFNQNLAIELGYLQLHNQTGTLKLAPTSAWNAGTMKLKQNAIDIAVKGILPITDKFDAYAKLGAAYLTSTIIGKFGNAKDNYNQYFGIDQHTLAPEAAVGASYNVTQNMFVDASLTHIQPMGKNRPGNVDFAAVGIGYSFG